MSLYWSFDLGAVARRCLYLGLVEGTESVWDVQLQIEAFRHALAVRPRVAIPG
jgi:hypothetical protein